MANTQTGAVRVRARSHEVVDYHYDEQRPGKPLFLLIPGGLIALASLVLIVYLGYLTFIEETLEQGTGMILMLAVAPFYAGGVFLFSYGYELYDVPKALRDTAIIVFITVAAIVILAVLGFALGAVGKSRSSSSSGKKSSGSSGSGEGFNLGGILGGSSAPAARGPATSSMRPLGDSIGPIWIGSSSHTNTVTREVVREVPVAPLQPQPIKCPNCGRSYIPSQTRFACPSCGAPTPQDLIDESAPAGPAMSTPN